VGQTEAEEAIMAWVNTVELGDVQQVLLPGGQWHFVHPGSFHCSGETFRFDESVSGAGSGVGMGTERVYGPISSLLAIRSAAKDVDVK
jgi:hypothetical protein